jgi:uncharacterized membrane protein YeiB
MDYLFLSIGCAFIALVFMSPYFHYKIEQRQRRALRRRLAEVGRQGLTNQQYQQCQQFKIIRGGRNV